MPSQASIQYPVHEQWLPVSLLKGDSTLQSPVRYRLMGKAGLPLIVVLGGINSGRKLSDWWPDQVGRGKPLDPTRYRLLGMDWLEAGSQDAVYLSTHDQARALEQILRQEGINRIDAAVGASYGAMVALALAERNRLPIDHLILVSGAHCSHPAATATRQLQRDILRLGEMAGLPRTGVAIARGLAMLSYRTGDAFAARFDGVDPDQRLQTISDWLSHVGRRFASTTTAHRYRQLSESLDRHQVDPRAIHGAVTLIAVDSDQLVPLSQLQALARSLAGPCRLQVIHSPYGHDAFLKEGRLFNQLLYDCFKESSHATA